MQDKTLSESQCHYPGCTSLAVRNCRKCHQSFCGVHIHRRWWSYTCEFCLLLKVAGKTPERDARFEDGIGRGPGPEELGDVYSIPDEQEKLDKLDS